MILFKKLITLLLTAGLICNIGCEKAGSVSLEEALRASAGYDKVVEGVAGASDYEDDFGDAQTGTADADSSDTNVLYYVYVCGSVVKPGVYTLAPGSRIVAAIEAAGGFSPEAATEAVNLAEQIQDGMQIIVPDLEGFSVRQEALEREEKGLVNLNTASAAELCTLSGIGEAKAEAILAYREEIGSFGSIEQLKEVSGIGDSLFNQIKNNIYIE